MKSSELSKVPYIDVEALAGRPALLFPFWDGIGWKLWLPHGDVLFEMNAVEFAQGDYIALDAARKTDVFIPCLDSILRAMYARESLRSTQAVVDDVVGVCSSLVKLEMIHRQCVGGNGVVAGDLVRSEIKSLLVLLRSMFDVVYEIVRLRWESVRLLDEAANKIKQRQTLPKSLSKLILSGESPVAANHLMTKYALPPSIAEAFSAAARNLLLVRGIRDDLVHNGHGVETIFCSEQGFSIGKDGRLARMFGGWRVEHRQNDYLVSLRPVIAHVIGSVLGSVHSIIGSFRECILIPSAIREPYRVFLRHPFAGQLVRTLAVLNGGDPWWSNEGEIWDVVEPRLPPKESESG